jgi:thiamine pyrophosphate-dependent acetolactate synthase large subunit-like protein
MLITGLIAVLLRQTICTHTGDISNTIWQLSEVITKPQPSWDLRYFNYVKEEMFKDFERDTNLDCFPIAMPRLVKAVRQSVPDRDTIVCLDNGLYKVTTMSRLINQAIGSTAFASTARLCMAPS